MSILIKNARIIDPSQGIDETGDLLIEKDKIVSVGQKVSQKAKTIIDAKGKILAPGLVDMHTHLREPGREDKETIATGLKAAVNGGYTTVCAMPNTTPACDSQAHVRFLLEKAKQLRFAQLIPIGSITKNRDDNEMTEMGDLRDAGCLAVSDDGTSVSDPDLMRKALEYASMLGLLVISHCEDKNLSGDGVMYEGYWSTVLGLAPIPAAAESIIVERDIMLAELSGARLHIAHVSTGQSINIIRAAKKRGVNVTAEVTPHHLSLTDEAVQSFDTNLKVNPPLSSFEDVKELKKAVKDSTIDVIATDHAPHLQNEKEKEFNYAPFGMIGLETALSLANMALIEEGIIDWPVLIGKMSTAPSAILGIKKGSLKEGAQADVILIDPEKPWVYTKDKIMSKACNSPFINKEMRAEVTDVIVAGQIVKRNGQVL